MHDTSLLAEPDTPLPVPSPSAIFRSVTEGAVVFSTASEVYFGVNAIGARIWELLPPANLTVGELCAAMASGFPEVSEVRIRDDVQQFLKELLSHGLLVTSPPNVAHLPAV